MQNQNIEKQIAFLLSAAMKKCGNMYDAEDLTQETLLSALSYLSQGKSIQDVRAWLLTVMNRKFADMLRRKYRQAIIHIDDIFDVIDEDASLYSGEANEEAENL